MASPAITKAQWQSAHRQLDAVLKQANQEDQDWKLRSSCSLCLALVRLIRVPRPRRSEVEFDITTEHGKCQDHAAVLLPRDVGVGYQIHLVKPAGQTFVYIYSDLDKHTAEASSSFGLPWEPLFLKESEIYQSNTRLPISPRLIDREWIDIRLLKEWHSTCRSYHNRTCGTGEPDIDPSFPNLLLVDTKRKCLVEKERRCRYVALSYVWGNTNFFLTTTSNIQDLCQTQALEQPHIRLPKTLEQAISLALALGEQYIWIDALCIVQDGPDKADQLNAMASLYANSTLTIVAGEGGHADAGFRGLHGISEPRHAEQKIATISKHECLVRPSSKHVWDNSFLHPWSTRAWTFQEAMCSHRLLYFANGTVRWGCKATRWSEESEAVDCISTYAGAEKNALDLLSPQLKMHKLPVLGEYEALINSYNTRKFTYDEDALIAFAGVATRLADNFNGGLISGMPEMFFDICLLWRPLRRIGDASRRRPKGLCTSPALLPSWSWAGWETDVTWPYTWNLDQDYAGPTPIMLGNIRPFYRIQLSYIASDGGKVPISATWFDDAVNMMEQDYLPDWESISIGDDLLQDWDLKSETFIFRHHSERGPTRFCFPISLSTSIAPARNTNTLSFRTTTSRFKFGETRSSVVRLHTMDNRPAGTLWQHDNSDSEFIRSTIGPLEDRISIELIAILGCTIPRETDFMWEMPDMSVPTTFKDFEGLPRTEDIYNVMWITWEDNATASRKGTGIVRRDIWETEAVDWINVELN